MPSFRQPACACARCRWRPRESGRRRFSCQPAAPVLWPGLRTGPPALTEGLQSCVGAETFGRGPWRGPETPPQRSVVARSPDRATGFDRRSPKLCRSGDLRSRTVAGSGDPAPTEPQRSPRLRCGLVNISLLRRLQVLIIELIDRPQETARHEIEITIIRHGVIIVTERRGKDACFALVHIGPDGDHIFRTLFAVPAFDDLFAARDGMSCFQ